ncbi:unnamed protein product, partial [marine sediment metagenome]
LVASTNPGKVSEISAMLGGDVEWVGLGDFAGIAEIVEDGASFAANARKKALGYAKLTGCWTIADDSGLVIDELGGEPGVNSARFSGERENGITRKEQDKRNIAKVLELLSGAATEKRGARFVCCLCLAKPEGVLFESEGTVEGYITESEIGENGFGYDPIFYIAELGRTAGQLSRQEKNSVSHRGGAIRKLKPFLKKLLEKGR